MKESSYLCTVKAAIKRAKSRILFELFRAKAGSNEVQTLKRLEQWISECKIAWRVDFYATESDKNNQDCYVDIFRPDIKLNVYFGGKLGMSATDVQDMICQYKAFGAAKVSFHMNGQQNVDFVDETHATGTCYALATLVTEQEGKDVLTTHAVRYYDKYVKIDGRWWIAEREQYFEWSTNQTLG
jgi:hypothetical protein